MAPGDEFPGSSAEDFFASFTVKEIRQMR